MHYFFTKNFSNFITYHFSLVDVPEKMQKTDFEIQSQEFMIGKYYKQYTFHINFFSKHLILKFLIDELFFQRTWKITLLISTAPSKHVKATELQEPDQQFVTIETPQILTGNVYHSYIKYIFKIICFIIFAYLE